MPELLYWPDRGWLFVARDGALYHAEYDPSSWTVGCYKLANGWEVDEVRPEWWGKAFPPYEEED